MKQTILSLLMLAASIAAFSQQRFPKNEISINGFRSPSIGLEYRHYHFSVHTGYYLTAFSGNTTNFFKTGLTYWFFPVGKKEMPSSFFAGASYMYGLNQDYKHQNALGLEAGFRWTIWKGVNFRAGGIAVIAQNQTLKINPAAGISYSIKF